MTKLFLVRHAEGYTNLKAIAAGLVGDTGLTELGIEQAGKLRRRLEVSREIQPDVIFSSDLPRARQTAEIVASLWGLPVNLDKDFREINAGEADGLLLDEIRQQYDIEKFWHDHFYPLAPGGESHAQFAIRASLALQRVTAEYEGKTILIFTHGSVIDSSFFLFFNVSPFISPPIGFSNRNTAITYWQRTPQAEHAPARWQLNFHNNAAHLNNL